MKLENMQKQTRISQIWPSRLGHIAESKIHIHVFGRYNEFH